MERYTGSGGSGAKISTYPFGVESLRAHCAGGAGGTNDKENEAGSNRYYIGGAGGSNGSAGSKGSVSTDSGWYAEEYAKGGDYGGGNAKAGSGGNGRFYGAGAAGGYGTNYGGKGYQGVAYILIPA